MKAYVPYGTDVEKSVRKSVVRANAENITKLKRKVETMLWTIIAVLLVLWILGLVTSIGGGLIHLLLVIAVILVLVRLFTGRTV